MKRMEISEASHTVSIEHESSEGPGSILNGNKPLQNPEAANLEGHHSAATSIRPNETSLPARRKSKSKRAAFVLPQADTEILKALKQRCESVGLKIRKTQLLVAGLHLLSSMPMGKFLAVIGPLEPERALLRSRSKEK